MAITKIILQQMVTMDQNSITASKYPKYTVVLSNSISSITAGELTTAIESSKASAAAAKQSEINAKQSELNAKDSENEAEISAASSQQSATQSASSATASANSAKAAKTSETNAKASETAAKTSETNANSSKTAAAASASAAKTSETNAKQSELNAKDSENEAETSAREASTHAGAAKTEAGKAKAEADRAKAEADRASANSYTISFAGGAGWFKLATVTMPQSTSTVSIKMVGGKGYNANSPQQAGITELVLRAGNGKPKDLSGSLWRRTTEGFSSMAWINTSGDVYDVYVEIGNYATAVNIQVNYTTNASVVLHSQPQYYATKPEGLTTCTIYDLYNPLLPPPDDGTSLKKALNLSDLPDKSQARTNLDLDRFRQFVNAGETQVKCADGTKQIFIKNTGDWGVWDNQSSKYIPLAIAQGGTGGVTDADARTNLGLGRSSSPTFGHVQLLTENDSAQASSGILSQFLRDTSGAQRARSRIYSEIRGDNKAWLTLHLQSDANTNKYAGLSIDGNFQINGNFIGNAISLSDVAASKVNLQVNRFLQATGETDVVNHAGTAQIFITDNKNWGAYDKELKRHIALPITQGGTGSLSISEAKTNLQIPSVGAGDWMEIAAPAGVEAGKYYPIIIKAQYASLYASGFFIDIQTRSSSGSDPMNCCAFNGFIRTGGWSDRKDAGYGYYNRYGSSELALKCILVSAKNAEDNIAVYVEGRAFPVKMRIPQFCIATAVASASTYGEVTFAWGTSNPDTDSVGVNTLFDFSLNRVGFYQASTEGNYYIGNGQRIVLSNGMSVGDELSLTTPKITFSGTVAAGNGFIADGTSVSNATFYSRYRVGDMVYGAEFRASENAGEIVIRDPSGGTDHKFFGFGYDGSLSLNGAIKPGSPIDISYGGTGATTAPEARQKIGGQWEETQKFLNSEAIVMLRPSASVNQWIAFYREDGTAAIRLGHETDGSLSAHSYKADGSYRKKILQIDEDATVNLFSTLNSNSSINGTFVFLKQNTYPRVELVATDRSGSTDIGARVSFEIPSLAGNPPYFVQRSIHNNTNQFVNTLPSTGGVLAVQGTSGREYKKDISTADSNEALSRVTSLEMVNFVYKDDEKQRVRFGIIAEDAEKIAPQYIKHNQFPVPGTEVFDDEGNKIGEEYQDRPSVDINPIVMDLLGCIQAQQKQIDELKELVKQLLAK